MARVLRLVSLFGLNAVPAAGIFLGGWSFSTALVLYWWENFFGSLLIAIRILVHRSVTRKRGHYLEPLSLQTETNDGHVQTTARRQTFLAGFLGTMLPFTIAHGIFLAVIVFLFLPQEQGAAATPNVAELKEGFVGMTGFLLAGLCIDLVGIRQRSFAWLKQTADAALGRMLVVHLTIIFGFAAFAYFAQPRAFFGVFVGLKALLDLAWWWPQQKTSLQDDPPKWSRRLAGRFVNEEEFAKAWHQERQRLSEVELRSEDAPN